MQAPAVPTRSAAVIGLGNIGSHLAPLVARRPDVGRIVLIDKDAYEPKNTQSQLIDGRDVGRSKARAQARRLRAIGRELVVEAVHDDVRNVPMGRLRVDVIFACLDSRAARQYVNEVAWRLGVPWIDSGVRADGMLARVNVYAPRLGGACLECGWDERDYAVLEQTYPCGSGTESAATNAPASLGALAASLQAIEGGKVLDGGLDPTAVGRQILIDASTSKHYVTSFARNDRCRFDHAVWDVVSISDSHGLTLAGLFEAARRAGADGPMTLTAPGKTFARRLTCPGCGSSVEVFGLPERLPGRLVTCGCGERMVAGGFDRVREVDPCRVTTEELGRSLGRLGLRAGDIVTVRTAGRDLHLEL